MMYPNSNYLRFFPDVEIPEEDKNCTQSNCLRGGALLVIRRIIAEYHLNEMFRRIIGNESGLFLDLAAYTIVVENNAGQYYPDYAYNHPLFTIGMKVYSDTKVSDFINSISQVTGHGTKRGHHSLRQEGERIMARARRNISIDEKIEQQKQVFFQV